MKLRKTTTGTSNKTTDYAGNYIYENGNLQFMNHPEGYSEPNTTGGYDYIYQYKDHLGNIRLSHKDVSSNSTPVLEIQEENNYYPFGMLQPERNSNSPEYRYGFLGQEKDSELKGEGNSLNYKYRMHDPRLGRFFAVDPLTKKYPYYTPYSFSGNKVIHAREIEGMEELIVINSPYVRDAVINYMKSEDVLSAVWASRNAYIWNDQEQVRWAKKTFDTNQSVDAPSAFRYNTDEFDDKGVIVLSYNNEDQLIKLFDADIEFTPELIVYENLLSDFKNWLASFDWDITGNEKQTSSSSSSQGGVHFVVRNADPSIGLVRVTGNPDLSVDITELYAGASRTGAGATKSDIFNRVYNLSKAISKGEAGSKLLSDQFIEKNDPKYFKCLTCAKYNKDSIYRYDLKVGFDFKKSENQNMNPKNEEPVHF